MTEQRKKKLISVLRKRQPDLTIIIEDIYDPHNVSAILRSADAVGISEIQLVYTSNEFPELGKKSSASAKKWIKIRKFNSIEECCKNLHSEGFLIYATHLGKKSKSLYDLDLTQKVAFVFGNEHRGVSEKAIKFSDDNFQIPMMGMIPSLNVSVACAVTLYETLRQRMVKGHFKKSKLSRLQREEILMQWIKK